MIALLAVLAACGGSAPPTSTPIETGTAEALELDAVVQAWGERQDLPALDAARLRTMRVIDPPTREEYLDLCRAGLGCTLGRNRCSWMWCGRDVFAVVSPTRGDGSPVTPGSRLSLIRHEAVHFAASIAGLGPDAGHDDHRLWPYHCGPHPRPAHYRPSPEDLACRAPTVEERARAIAGVR